MPNANEPTDGPSGKMALEVDEEPLPVGWEVVMSRSKNMPYYYNARSKKVYWVDDALPRGWAHQFDQKGVMFYFHIRDKNATVTYDKPVLRQAARRASDADRDMEAPPPESPDPLPVPAPSYSDDHARRNSNTSEHDGSPARSRSGSTASASWGAAHDDAASPAALPARTMERKKSNSLMDLLSPGPPALANDRSPGTFRDSHSITLMSATLS